MKEYQDQEIKRIGWVDPIIYRKAFEEKINDSRKLFSKLKEIEDITAKIDFDIIPRIEKEIQQVKDPKVRRQIKKLLEQGTKINAKEILKKSQIVVERAEIQLYDKFVRVAAYTKENDRIVFNVSNDFQDDLRKVHYKRSRRKAIKVLKEYFFVEKQQDYRVKRGVSIEFV